MNNNLEEDLCLYCVTKDSILFEEKIYNPLTYIAKSICAKNKATKREYQDGIVEDMVSHISITLPEYFDSEKKGKSKSAAYILMSQYLSKQRSFNNKKKRSSKMTFYIEDIENFEGVIEINIDPVQIMKLSLENKNYLFEKLNNKLHYDISQTIIDAINNPDKYECHLNSYVKSIAIKCQCTVDTVHNVIKSMNRLVSNTY